ncbi:hypothetical protein K2173_025952 [Erythroxylum novogranatense]|uniref:GRAM domain-containing protein n=1 Tax=Erythroxylum novogranatense TaxID=1862640 RepID=A0AAV8TYD0_9ROSI|nr:hypothetical protein K2173_025952 [Erythroxylum novogranatense]
MEPHPKPETERKPEPDGLDPQRNQTLKDLKADDVLNVEANKIPSVAGSESQTSAAESEQVQATNRNGSTRKSVRWSPDLVSDSRNNSNSYNNSGDVYFDGSNPYTSSSPASSSPSLSFKERMGTVKNVLGRWGKKVGEASRKAEDLAGNTWQHLKTSPSFTEAALGRLAQGTKVLAEGGYEKIFRQTFETVPEEILQNSYACYLSTSAGPVMGVLYVSTAKLAFCSDNPLSYQSGEQTEWSYYKVVIPLHQLKAINPSSSRANPAEKYIQVISADNHEFWFMGFLNYNGAVQYLQDAMRAYESETV